MSRFLSWLALAMAAAFLLVVSASFSLGAIATLAFAISIGSLVVSGGLAVYDRRYAGHGRGGRGDQRLDDRRQPGLLPSPVQNLALGAPLAISGLAIVG